MRQLLKQVTAAPGMKDGGPARTRLGIIAGVLLSGSMLGAVLFAGSSAAGKGREANPEGAESQTVKVITKREGDLVHFLVDNHELCDVTMTFEMDLLNLKSSASFPYTSSFEAGKLTEAFTLSPREPDEKWGYSYTNYYKLGSCCARHEDGVLYQLPYEAGSVFRVTQAYGGTFSHKGSNKYAIDWKMPEGTLVCAARGGLVVKTKDDSNRGGSSIKYDRYNNFVLIRQDDGTLAHYCHLKKGGCLVKPGQVVRAGDPIARSGNTGFSSGPHLHFCVFKTKDGRERESIPVRFTTAEAASATLVEGHNYTAGRMGTVSAQLTLPKTAQGGVSQ